MSAHSLLVKQLECLACEFEGVVQPFVTEAHHQNLDGKAGQKRLGDLFQVPLCSYHHRGKLPEGMNRDQAAYHYGPSKAYSPRLFTATYGSDEVQLARTQAKLAQFVTEGA